MARKEDCPYSGLGTHTLHASLYSKEELDIMKNRCKGMGHEKSLNMTSEITRGLLILEYLFWKEHCRRLYTSQASFSGFSLVGISILCYQLMFVSVRISHGSQVIV